LKDEVKLEVDAIDKKLQDLLAKFDMNTPTGKMLGRLMGIKGESSKNLQTFETMSVRTKMSTRSRRSRKIDKIQMPGDFLGIDEETSSNMGQSANSKLSQRGFLTSRTVRLDKEIFYEKSSTPRTGKVENSSLTEEPLPTHGSGEKY